MNKRRLKRYMNHLSSNLKFGMYFENCNYQPSIVTSRTLFSGDINGWDVTGNNMVDGGGCSCSLYHCAPWPLSKKNAELRADYLKIEGNKYSDPEYIKIVEQDYESHYLSKLWHRIGI